MKIMGLFSAFALVALAAELPPMPKEYLADPAEVIRAAAEVTSRKYPDADIVMLDDRIHTAYEADGTDVMWDDEWVKVLTEKGRRSRTTLTLDVSLRYGDAAIELVEIIGTNGVARRVDFRKTLKMATDNSSTSSNIYDPLDKKISCAVPGLSVGEIRHVRFCRRTRKARMRGAWADRQLFEHTAPICRTVVTVDQPKDNPIRHAVVRHGLDKTVTRAPDRPLGNGRTLLRWEVRDVPQAFPEPAMPPISEELQALRLSTVADWPTVSRWYWGLCAGHLDAGTPGLTNKVSELVAAVPDDEAKIRALFRFVSQQVRYMGITAEDDAPGYEPHDVGLTFENRYGVCRDKAALLVAMLNLAGFEARPVLIRVGAKMDPEIPSPYFNHAIAAVRQNGEWALMDPTDEAARDLLPTYLSDCSYLVASPQGEPLRVSPVVDVRKNMLEVDSDGSLSPDGSALLTTHFRFGGINDTVLRHSFVKKTEDMRRRMVEGILRRVTSGAELLSCEITPSDLADTEAPLSLKTIARFPGVVLRGETRDELAPPLMTRVLSVANALLDENTALEKRRYPLQFDSTAGTEEHLTLRLGDVLGAPFQLPPEVHVGEGTSHEYHCVQHVTNGVLEVTRRQLLKGLRFEVPDYNRLRDDRKLMEGLSRAEPTFKARANVDADTRLILSRREIVFASPTCWVETNVVEKEVLTYQGKKSSAELKIGYNPATRSVDLVSATVSNRNGKVFSVTEKERHLLDCGWAAAAPRYPAGKTLVVNLPGVEIGSVIRYMVVRAVTNSPLAFTSFTTFDSTQPIDRMTVKMSMPDDMPFAWRSTGFDRSGAVELEDHKNGRRRLAWSVKSPPRLPREPSQAAASLWRTTVFATAANWEDYAQGLLEALAAARAGGTTAAEAAARDAAAGCTTPEEKIQSVRRYLAHHMRTSGPGLFELPFAQAFFPPDRSLADSYASSADRKNLAYAMLKALGFDCSFVLCADDSHGLKELTRLYQDGLPRPDFFDALVIRAVQNGRVFYLAGENEHTPPMCSAREGDTYFDPQSCTFGEARLEEVSPVSWWAPWTWWRRADAAAPGTSRWSPKAVNYCRLTVREDGGVDFDVTNRAYGVSVGSFRKRFTEMLPERRSRFYQSLLGEIAEGASATSDLVTDVEAYPALTAFSAYVPEYATAVSGEITLRVPDLDSGFLSVGSDERHSPIATGGATERVDINEVVFPKGFTEIEHLPAAYELCDPASGEPWVTFSVTTKVEARRLLVTLVKHTHRRTTTVLGADYAPFFRDWNRRMAARAASTIVVRRAR